MAKKSKPSTMMITIQLRMLGRFKKSKETESLELLAGLPSKEKENLHFSLMIGFFYSVPLQCSPKIYMLRHGPQGGTIWKVVGPLKSRTL